jgi:protein disulfide-isomerase A6
LLLNKDKKVPLLWQVLSNKYGQQFQFGSHHDVKGKTYVSMGLKASEKKASKVVVYPAGSTVPVLYEGLQVLLFLTHSEADVISRIDQIRLSV